MRKNTVFLENSDRRVAYPSGSISFAGFQKNERFSTPLSLTLFHPEEIASFLNGKMLPVAKSKDHAVIHFEFKSEKRVVYLKYCPGNNKPYYNVEAKFTPTYVLPNFPFYVYDANDTSKCRARYDRHTFFRNIYKDIRLFKHNVIEAAKDNLKTHPVLENFDGDTLAFYIKPYL